MGMIDEDYPDKGSQHGLPKRSVKTSGLGALKGLSKYSKLTDKFKTKPPLPASEALTSPAADGVEQSCGTNSTQDLEVSANSVQSQCKKTPTSEKSRGLSSDTNPPASSESKSVQSQGEVGADSLRGAADSSFGETETSAVDRTDFKEVASIEVSAKSVQGSDTRNENEISSKDLTGSKSVQSPSNREMGPVGEGLSSVEDPSEESVPGPTQSEVRAKSVQSPSILSAKSVRNSVQSQGEVRADQTDFNRESVQSQYKVSSKVRAKVGAKLVQTQCKLEPLEPITSLSGAQRIVVEFIFEQCLWNQSLVTPPITKQRLLQETQLPEQTALSAIKRLRHKLIIDRESYKDGKAGWTQYRIADESYRELLQLGQFSAKSVQSPSKVSPVVSSQVSAEPSSSSISIKDLEKTNTTQPSSAFDALPLEWQQVDLSLVEETACRFSKADVVDIFKRGMLTSQQFQESLEHLRFDLLDQKKTLNRAVVFGVIKKNGAPWISEAYLKSLEREVQTQLAAAARLRELRLEQTKAKEDLEFQSWFEALTPEEKLNLARTFQLKSVEGPMFEAYARNYYQSSQQNMEPRTEPQDESPDVSQDIRKLIQDSLGGIK
jgi:hypothetical protein